MKRFELYVDADKDFYDSEYYSKSFDCILEYEGDKLENIHYVVKGTMNSFTSIQDFVKDYYKGSIPDGTEIVFNRSLKRRNKGNKGTKDSEDE